MLKKILEFTTTVPKIGVGKKKNQLVLMNNVTVWKRYYESKIKKQLKDTLTQWAIPESTAKHLSGTVEFQLYRPTKNRLDADSIAFVGKWTVDLLVQLGWFLDDDQITFVYKPVVVEADRVETEVKVSVFS